MDDFIIREVIEKVELDKIGEGLEVINTNECEGSIFVIKNPITFNRTSQLIYQKILDDGKRLFRNPFGEDAIDLEENTPLFNTILNLFMEKGLTQHTAAHLTPIVFDKIANIAYSSYINNYEKPEKEFSLSDYIARFGLSESDALTISKLIARDEATEREIEMFAQYIYLLSPHSLFNEPVECHYGEWKLIKSPDKLNKDDFRKGLLIDFNNKEQKTLF